MPGSFAMRGSLDWAGFSDTTFAIAGFSITPVWTGGSLYLELSSVGLDTGRVFKVRGASLDRSAIHITLEDGTIAFTKDVLGRITGLF